MAHTTERSPRNRTDVVALPGSEESGEHGEHVHVISNVLLPTHSYPVDVELSGGVIARISPAETSSETPRLLSSGFVDIQLNGALGVDFSSPRLTSADVERVLRWLPSTGVTAVVATVISSPASTYLKVVPVLRGLFRASASNLQRPTARARLLGIHLEGPFLCAARRGAHDEAQLATPLSLAAVMARCALLPSDLEDGFLRVITLAPELPGALDVIADLRATRVLVAIGHTEADYALASTAVDAGANLVTHMFNAMPPLHHRAPGVVGLLGRPRASSVPFFSVIADGCHLHDATLCLAFRAAPHRAVLITDAMAGLGLPPGCYNFVSGLSAGTPTTITVRAGGCEGEAYQRRHVVLDGSTTLAGAVAGMETCVRALYDATGREDAFAVLRAATGAPAEALGEGLGLCVVGAPADLVLLSADLQLVSVWVRGQLVDTADADRIATEAVEAVRRTA